VSKEVLREEMRVKGLLAGRDNQDPLWKQAFDLYIAETGDKEVSMKCGMCYGKVKKWLEK
jgi:hypothetical protein